KCQVDLVHHGDRRGWCADLTWQQHYGVFQWLSPAVDNLQVERVCPGRQCQADSNADEHCQTMVTNAERRQNVLPDRIPPPAGKHDLSIAVACGAARTC